MSTMHRHDAPPPTIDQIIGAIEGCEASRDEVRELIAVAIADARREGAAQMRGQWLALRDRIKADVCRPDGRWGMHGHEAVDDDYFAALEWVLDRMDEVASSACATGQRQAARLTDEQIGRVCCAALHEEYVEPAATAADQAAHAALMLVGRSIEAAVIEANGLEGGAA